MKNDMIYSYTTTISEEIFMKKDSSVAFTSLAIKAGLILCVISLFVMPYAAKVYKELTIMDNDVTVPLLITFYTCAAVGMFILVILDRLINNIRKGNVFIEDNVKYLRILSYACLIISVITLIFAAFRFLACIITFSSLFFALIKIKTSPIFWHTYAQISSFFYRRK